MFKQKYYAQTEIKESLLSSTVAFVSTLSHVVISSPERKKSVTHIF